MPKCHQSVLLKPGYVLESPRSVVILHLIRSSEMRSRPEPLSDSLVYVDYPSRAPESTPEPPPELQCIRASLGRSLSRPARDTSGTSHTHTHTHTRDLHTHTHTNSCQRARVRVVWHTFSVSPGWTTTASPTCAVTCSPSLSPFLSFSSPLLDSIRPIPLLSHSRQVSHCASTRSVYSPIAPVPPPRPSPKTPLPLPLLT